MLMRILSEKGLDYASQRFSPWPSRLCLLVLRLPTGIRLQAPLTATYGEGSLRSFVFELRVGDM